MTIQNIFYIPQINSNQSQNNKKKMFRRLTKINRPLNRLIHTVKKASPEDLQAPLFAAVYDHYIYIGKKRSIRRWLARNVFYWLWFSLWNRNFRFKVLILYK